VDVAHDASTPPPTDLNTYDVVSSIVTAGIHGDTLAG